mmetsp:Transcript_12318/g.16210  ORF Transcript_12318/g.16210 Transcript_12318/m.16210 type:complete len:195 (-) Transcript_12318:222-806(-)
MMYRPYSLATSATLTLVFLARYTNASGRPLPTHIEKECLPVGPPSTSSFHCVSVNDKQLSHRQHPSTSCLNQNPKCDSWANTGECSNNPSYMLVNCPSSCDSCIDLHSGATQRIPETGEADLVMQKLLQTQAYVMEEFLLTTTSRQHYHTNRAFLRDCQNKHDLCTFWAVHGKCENDKSWMNENCSAACHSCHS